ncbi:hypothetical protein D9M69_218760 [compost metagenome]
MSNAPFDHRQVIERLKATVPALREIGTAADFKAVKQLRDFPTPAAYVLLAEESGEPKPAGNSSGPARQRVGALVAGTDYRIESANAGLVEFLTPQATAVTAAYDSEEAVALTMFTQQPPERWFVLDGIDTETGKSVIVDLFRCKFNPVGTLGLIHEEYGSLPLTGSVLYDPLNAGDPLLGGYGRYIEKKAA